MCVSLCMRTSAVVRVGVCAQNANMSQCWPMCDKQKVVRVFSIWLEPRTVGLSSYNHIFEAASLSLKTCLQLKTLYGHMLISGGCLAYHFVNIV